MMLRIAICDDEAEAIVIVKRLLQQSFAERGIEAECTTYTSAEVLLKVIRNGTHYDLLLLDIDMPQMDGIELGIAVQEQLLDTLLVYVSGREERVFDSFRAKPFRFVRKSALAAEWPTVMQDIEVELQRRKASRIVFESSAMQLSLKPSEIIYAEALKKKQVLHTTRGEYDLSDSFENVVSQLDGLGFIRIHRSYVVNFRFMYAVNRTDVELDDGTLLPIGRSKHMAVQQEFHRLVMSGT